MADDMIARLVTRAARGPAAEAAIHVAERLAPWRRGVIAFLTYHRVDEPGARPDLWPGLISATPSAFPDHVADLVRHYRPVSMAEVLDGLREPRRLPPRAVHVTFDDAYADFATQAWPVLRAASVPVTLFVPTAYPDRAGPGFWWDRLWQAVSTTSLDFLPVRGAGPAGGMTLQDPAARSAAARVVLDWVKTRPHDVAMSDVDRLIADLRPDTSAASDVGPSVLSWNALRQLAAEGVTLAPHTRTHPLLDRVTEETAATQIRDARADLEREIGPTLPILAYPSGAHGGAAVEAARSVGTVLAVTTKRGGNDLRRIDPLLVRRINVGLRAHSPLIRAQLLWASVIDARRP